MISDELLKKINSLSWYHTFNLTDNIVTPGVRNCTLLLDMLNIPDDCHGMRVLDIGTADGFFSFEMERRGADVVSVDYHVKETFWVVKEVFKSKIEPVHANIYNLNKQDFGEFDVVLFLGVLYHLRNPILALDKIRNVCKEKMYLETTCIDNGFHAMPGQGAGNLPGECLKEPIAQFHPRNTFNSDYTNYWSFNSVGLTAVLEETLFKVNKKTITADRCLMECEIAEDDVLRSFIDIESGLR